MSFFNLRQASIKRKIGGLFVTLLAFLFIVILFSAYKLKSLESEMKEVAYIDIPLSQMLSQIEFIEMEQHLKLEEYRLSEEEGGQVLVPHQRLVLQKQQIKALIDRAVGLLESSLDEGKLVLEAKEHQLVLKELRDYQTKSIEFEAHLTKIYDQLTVTPKEIELVESLSDELEKEQRDITSLLGQITRQDAYFMEKHEEQFLVINTLLGAAALLLGLFLTVYIVRIILTRITNIQQDIRAFDQTFSDQHENDELLPKSSPKRDELEDLQLDIKALMSKLSQEMTSREQFEQHLVMLATKDKLTGAYNRHKWDEQIEIHLNLAERGYMFGLILLDVDNFKAVNDKYGHLVGDNLLKGLVEALNTRLRRTDMLFRMGGEEFAILCPMKDARNTRELAETLRAHIETSQFEQVPPFTISLGVSIYQLNDDAESLYQRADRALYRAKELGRNRVASNELGSETL